MTLAQLERYLGVAAFLVVRHGDAYVPTFERLEQEVAAVRVRQDKRDRAQAVLSTMLRKGMADVAG